MDFFIHLAIIVSIYSILALSLNILAGYTGLISMATAAFMGVGSYFTAILLIRFDINFFLILPLAALFVGALALLVDFALARFKGDYFTLGTMGIIAIASGIFVNWQVITGGSIGIAGIPRPNIFGIVLSENAFLLVLAVVLLGITYFICEWITKSSFGRILLAIRDDEKTIEVFGYDTVKYKLFVFIISSSLASIAGSLFAVYSSYISPTSFTINDSIMVLTMVILGGIANNKGAILGAASLIIIPEMLRFIGLPEDIAANLRNVLYGLILILLMMYRPQGLLGEYKL